MTLEERIERVAETMLERFPGEYKPASWSDQTEALKNVLRLNARQILALAFPELFSSPPSMWLAPWMATEAMTGGHKDGQRWWKWFREHAPLSNIGDTPAAQI